MPIAGTIVAAGSIAKKLLPSLFKSNLDIANQMPKVLYQYKDTPIVAGQYRIFAVDGGRAFKSWADAWNNYLVPAGVVKAMNQVDPKNEVHSNTETDTKYFMAGTSSGKGYPVIGNGFNGVSVANGVEYDRNKVSLADAVQLGIEGQKQAGFVASNDLNSPSTMIAIVGIIIALITFK